MVAEHSGLEQYTGIPLIVNNKSAFEKLFVCRTLSEANGIETLKKFQCRRRLFTKPETFRFGITDDFKPSRSHMACPQRYTCVKLFSVFNGTNMKFRNPMDSFGNKCYHFGYFLLESQLRM